MDNVGPLPCTKKANWFIHSALLYFVHPCMNLPLYFERSDDFNIISVSGVTSQSRTVVAW